MFLTIIKILSVCVCILNFYTISHSQAIQDNAINEQATIVGVVTDAAGSLVPDTRVVIEGTRRFEAMTSAEGSYSIKLPPGNYRFSVEAMSLGFRLTRRSSAYLESNSKTEINFVLFGMHSVYLTQIMRNLPAGVILDHPYFGDFRFEEIFPPSLKKSNIKEIGIRYGEKEQTKTTTIYTADVTDDIKKYNGTDYPGVLLTYNLMTLQAQKITVDSKDEITAEGNVSINENGKKREKLKVVKLKIVNDTLIVNSKK